MAEPTPMAGRRSRKPKGADAQYDEVQIGEITEWIGRNRESGPWELPALAAQFKLERVDMLRYLREISTRAGYSPTEPIPYLNEFTQDPGEEGPINVSTYDAKGEAVDVEAKARKRVQEQPALPGMPPPRELWPRFDGYQVTEVEIAFPSGRIAVTDVEIANALRAGARFSVVIDVECVGRDHVLVLDRGADRRHMKGLAIAKIAESRYAELGTIAIVARSEAPAATEAVETAAETVQDGEETPEAE